MKKYCIFEQTNTSTMITLLKKEVNGFFSSLGGYIVIIVFNITNSLFMWVFPGKFNILEAGYANMDTLFLFAPLIFLFLVPAFTMKTFTEEKKTGTLELLLTRPLTDTQVVMAKYLASLVLVLFSLIPCLIYFWSVYSLGNPVGNIDVGGTWGSFIGLFCLAAVYVSIGVFASSLTDNQVIAFIIAVIISFFLFIGFEIISSLRFFRSLETGLTTIGINEHYKSMRRGVIDTRDVVYFISVSILFILGTKLVIHSRKWTKSPEDEEEKK